MTLKEQIKNIKTKCSMMALGNGHCWICGCKDARRGMVIHHRWYLKKGDVIYSDSKYIPHNDTTSLQYYIDLYPVIKRNPKRFMFLCNTDHQSLERFCRYGDKKFNKLCIARKMTKKYM